MLEQLKAIVQDQPARPHRGLLLFATLQPPATIERVLALYYWRFPSLIAAPPRQHGLGSASFFRRSAGANGIANEPPITARRRHQRQPVSDRLDTNRPQPSARSAAHQRQPRMYGIMGHVTIVLRSESL